MEENSQTLPFTFEKLSIKKKSPQDPPEEEEKLEIQATKLLSETGPPKDLSRQNTGSLFSQPSLCDGDIDDEISDASKTHFSQRKRNLDSALIRELKAIKTSVEEQKKDGNERITINLRATRRYKEETKAKAVELAEKIGPHQVSLKTGIPETSIRRWRKIGARRKSGSGRPPQYVEVEKELLDFFRDSRNAGLITNNSLLLEARKIAERLKVKDFAGTLSWLEGMKRRNGISYRKSTRVSQRISPTAREDVEEFQRKFVELYEKHQYPLGAIVNVDETGMNFDSVSNYTLDFKVKFLIRY